MFTHVLPRVAAGKPDNTIAMANGVPRLGVSVVEGGGEGWSGDGMVVPVGDGDLLAVVVWYNGLQRSQAVHEHGNLGLK